MEHLFLNRELSQLAKDKGFDEPCLAWWNQSSLFLVENGELENNNIKLDLSGIDVINAKEIEEFHKNDCSAPLYQQIIDFFDKKEIYLIPKLDISDGLFKWYGQIWIIIDYELKQTYSSNAFKSKYLCLDKAIEKAFKLI